jgi:DNA primase
MILDNDDAGRKAMAKYTDNYDVTAFNLELSKDIADSVRDLGPKKVRQEIFKLISIEQDELVL